MRIIQAGLMTAVVVLAGVSLSAHHSFAVFDMQAEKVVEGTVKQVEWTNPHIFVYLDVPKAGGGTEKFSFEGMSPNFLNRRGWERTTLKEGMKITVHYRPLKDGTPGGMFVSAKLPSGVTLTGGGAQQ